MKQLTQNSAIWFTFFFMLSFWIMNLYFTPGTMIEIASGVVLGLTATIMLTWAPATLRAIRTGPSEGPGMLAMGLFGVAAAQFLHRAWTNTVRWMGRPDWMVDSSFTAFMVWGLACAWVLVMLAPGTKQNEVPVRNYLWFFFSAGVGIFIAGISVGASLVHLSE